MGTWPESFSDANALPEGTIGALLLLELFTTPVSLFTRDTLEGLLDTEISRNGSESDILDNSLPAEVGQEMDDMLD